MRTPLKTELLMKFLNNKKSGTLRELIEEMIKILKTELKKKSPNGGGRSSDNNGRGLLCKHKI